MISNILYLTLRRYLYTIEIVRNFIKKVRFANYYLIWANHLNFQSFRSPVPKIAW